jgi:hypothetical protein
MGEGWSFLKHGPLEMKQERNDRRLALTECGSKIVGRGSRLNYRFGRASGGSKRFGALTAVTTRPPNGQPLAGLIQASRLPLLRRTRR